MFANIYSTLSKPIRRIRRPEDRSEVINWFVDSRANVASDILTHHEFGAFYALAGIECSYQCRFVEADLPPH
jgi:hypothetical protein